MPHLSSVAPVALVVDDSWRMRRLISEFVHTQLPQFSVVQTADGESAIESVIEQRPALVLMDIHLPGISGLEATRCIKSASPDTMVIVVSCSEEMFFGPLALKAGAHAYVRKDTLAPKLMSLLANLSARTYRTRTSTR